MLLLEGDRASITAKKVREYLLSVSHPIGRAKATFFRAHGYSEGNAQTLGHDLHRLAATGLVVKREHTPYGTKYVVEGHILTPRGTTIHIRTVWFVEAEGSAPRFVTAYPKGEGK